MYRKLREERYLSGDHEQEVLLYICPPTKWSDDTVKIARVLDMWGPYVAVLISFKQWIIFSCCR